jgi:hypothetical protein
MSDEYDRIRAAARKSARDGFRLDVLPEPFPSTPAGRLAFVQELLHPPIVDDNGDVIGYGDPLISEEEAYVLLDNPDTTSAKDDE